LRVERFEADPGAGYHAPFFLYRPRSVGSGRPGTNPRVTILVQPNNTGSPSDDAHVHEQDAWWTAFGRHGLADDLDVVLLVPAFQRPEADWRVYTHALDRDVLTTERADLARLDLQLLAMLAAASRTLEADGLELDPRILIQGFSASGMFANRFTALHPERVKAVAAGSPGGWPIAPLAEFAGRSLPYPAGVADLEALVGAPFDLEAFRAVPQLVVMGSLDDNDSLDFGDGWDEEHALLVAGLFGETPLARWPGAEALYAQAGASARFLLVEGIGHDRRALQHHTTDFLRKVLAEEAERAGFR
jgi:pimeloyl-ACP methyl ester carboxylesterase